LKKVAIVGSESAYWTPERRTKVVGEIVLIFRKYLPYYPGEITERWNEITLVSGGCPKGGVDEYAEIVADVLGIPKDIHRPESRSWVDGTEVIYETPLGNYEKTLKGYKTRNIEVATECDVLYCIDPKWRDWSGARWTMDYAKEHGKEVHLVLIE
jgi:hypothetical protein